MRGKEGNNCERKLSYCNTISIYLLAFEYALITNILLKRKSIENCYSREKYNAV